MGDLQSRANPCNARPITRNEQKSGSSPLVGSLYSVHWHYKISRQNRPQFTTFAEGSELEADDLASVRNYKTPEFAFCVLLAEGGAERLELARA